MWSSRALALVGEGGFDVPPKMYNVDVCESSNFHTEVFILQAQ